MAATGTYAGNITGTAGKIALDVKVQRGYVTKVTHVRVANFPSTCEISGPATVISNSFDGDMAVKGSGKFHGSFTQAGSGNVSTVRGQINHKHVSGTFHVNYHYEADGQFPAENCDTGTLAYTAKFGAPDETRATARPNWR
jgi:hypothetical protein